MRDFDLYYKEYMREPFEEYMVYFRRRMELKFLESYCPERWIEIGCGKEPMFEHWSNGEQIVVVEPQEIFFQNAKEKSVKYENVCVKRGLFQDLIDELGTSEWDAILCSGVLGEVDEPDEFLKTLFSICGINTKVMLITSNANSFHRLLGFEMGVIEDVHSLSGRSEKLQQRKVFDKKSMRSLVEQCGGKILDISSYFIKPFTHVQMRQCLEKKIITDQVLEGLWSMGKYMPEYGAELYCECCIR